MKPPESHVPAEDTASPSSDADSDQDRIAAEQMRSQDRIDAEDAEVTRNAANSTPRRNASSYFYTTRRNKLELKSDDNEDEETPDSDGGNKNETPDSDGGNKNENEINDKDIEKKQRDR
eukprot:jgi/Psemu1/23893/gm1.23893_g